MEIPEDVAADLNKRLRRAEGQVRAVQRMLEEGSDCREMITQITAASKAIDQVGFRLLACGMAQSIRDPEQAEAEGYPLVEIERLFSKLA